MNFIGKKTFTSKGNIYFYIFLQVAKILERITRLALVFCMGKKKEKFTCLKIKSNGGVKGKKLQLLSLVFFIARQSKSCLNFNARKYSIK